MSAAEVMAKLDVYSTELDGLSIQLAQVTRHLEPVEAEYQKFVDDHELGLYQRSIDEDNFKLPSEALRLKLAVRAMPPELYGKYTALTASCDRMRKRIGDLKVTVDAQRSILSALKAEMEATR